MFDKNEKLTVNLTAQFLDAVVKRFKKFIEIDIDL
jgi:hypothetical protein